jgi:hypothetical protein
VGEERVYDNRLLAYLVGKAPAASTGVEAEPADDAEAAPPLPAPASIPFWPGKNGEWRTNFPPPEGFTGSERGRFGETTYSRALSEAEQRLVEARFGRPCDHKPDTSERNIRVTFV